MKTFIHVSRSNLNLLDVDLQIISEDELSKILSRAILETVRQNEDRLETEKRWSQDIVISVDTNSFDEK